MQKRNNKNTPIYLKLYDMIKKQILSGGLPANHKLLSIREMAKRHGISSTTVEHTYQQLMVEGYIRSVPKSGFYVENIDPLKTTEPVFTEPEDEESDSLNTGQRPNVFDVDTYRKIVNDILMHDEALYKPSPVSGDSLFKTAITQHLTANRDVITQPSQIVIAAGIQQLIMQLATIDPEKNTVAYLIPGFKRAMHAFKLMGFSLFACETVEDMLNSKARYLYISPSNLYPSGNVLPVKDRLNLIKHAKTDNCIIIEDDYNHTFRYNAYQIPTIHNYAKGDRVIYIGSFSRTTLVSQRLSFMVLPSNLRILWNQSRFAPTVSTLEQRAMAAFIKKGYYQKHLRRLAKISKRVNDSLKASLAPYFDDVRFTLSGLDSNMHVVVTCQNPEFKSVLIHRLTANNMAYHTFEDMTRIVLIPYSGIDPDMFSSLFHKLLK